MSLNIEEINKFSKKLRLNILKMAKAGGSKSSHFGGALSSIDFLAVLFKYFFEYSEKTNKKFSKDQFILSKGHGCMAYYSILRELNLVTEEDLLDFEQDNSVLMGHPIKNLEKGINFSTGSLGMGLSLGLGICIANKIKCNDFKTFVVIGDGECNEGSIWEAAMLASSKKLNNLVVILDHNKFQQTGSTDLILQNDNLDEKWKSFGWETTTCDGHNYNEIYDCFKLKSTEKPIMIIANTIKGKGFSFSQNNNDWHHKILTSSLYDQAVKELNL
jgi:transketolase